MRQQSNTNIKMEDPTPPTPTPLDTLDGEVAEGVEIARLLKNSSLGDQEAIENRVIGRKEISKELRGRYSVQSNLGAAKEREDQIDERVAEELELRGYTFEAELRYRRLLHRPGSASRLAMLLEAKGFLEEAWELYSHAARLREPTALFRLAVICQQRGETQWAAKLASTASSAIASGTISELARNAEGLVAARGFKRPRQRVATGPVLGTPAATFAMGSILYVFADRSDLARTAFSSAVGRGHTPSALTLVDIASPRIEGGNRRLDQILCRAERDLRLTPRKDAVDALPIPLRRPLDLLRGSLGDSSFEELTIIARDQAVSASRTEARERIANIARTITLLRGYARSKDWSPNGVRRLTQASIEVGIEVERRIRSKPDGVRLATFIWDRAGVELAGRLEHEREGHLPLEYSQPVPEPGSGAVIRYREEFQRLPDKELQIFALNFAGLSSGLISEMLRVDRVRMNEILRRSIARLRAGQAGEQRLPEALKLLYSEVQEALDRVEGEDLVGGKGGS